MSRTRPCVVRPILVAIAMAVTLAAGSALPAPAAFADQLPAPDPHLAAAEELMELLQVERSMTLMTDVMLKAQIQGNPALADFEDIMRAFLDKYVGYRAMKDDLRGLYAATFTEKELREMLAFYNTPTGQKSIKSLPALLEQSSRIGATRVQEHMDELKAAVEARVKERSAPPPEEPRPAAEPEPPPDASPGL